MTLFTSKQSNFLTVTDSNDERYTHDLCFDSVIRYGANAILPFLTNNNTEFDTHYLAAQLYRAITFKKMIPLIKATIDNRILEILPHKMYNKVSVTEDIFISAIKLLSPHGLKLKSHSIDEDKIEAVFDIYLTEEDLEYHRIRQNITNKIKP